MPTSTYRGPVDTVEQAMMAHQILTITCQRCSRSVSAWAWRLYHRAPKAAPKPLKKAVGGFYCTGCKASVQVYISARREGEF